MLVAGGTDGLVGGRIANPKEASDGCEKLRMTSDTSLKSRDSNWKAIEEDREGGRGARIDGHGERVGNVVFYDTRGHTLTLALFLTLTLTSIPTLVFAQAGTSRKSEPPTSSCIATHCAITLQQSKHNVAT